jgi:hypothetical protein
MVGVGLEWITPAINGMTPNSVSDEAVLDFMYWRTTDSVGTLSQATNRTLDDAMNSFRSKQGRSHRVPVKI